MSRFTRTRVIAVVGISASLVLAPTVAASAATGGEGYCYAGTNYGMVSLDYFFNVLEANNPYTSFADCTEQFGKTGYTPYWPDALPLTSSSSNDTVITPPPINVYVNVETPLLKQHLNGDKHVADPLLAAKDQITVWTGFAMFLLGVLVTLIGLFVYKRWLRRPEWALTSVKVTAYDETPTPKAPARRQTSTKESKK